MGFIADIQAKYKTVSIVGMAKNAGKTTALNYLLEEAYDEGFRMGVTSTGRDGETSDLVFETDKPKVYLFEDTIVTVPEQLFGLAETICGVALRSWPVIVGGILVGVGGLAVYYILELGAAQMLIFTVAGVLLALTGVLIKNQR